MRLHIIDNGKKTLVILHQCVVKNVGPTRQCCQMGSTHQNMWFTFFWSLHPNYTACLHLINRRPLHKQDRIKSHQYNIHIAYQHYSTGDTTSTISTTSIVSVGVCNVIDIHRWRKLHVQSLGEGLFEILRLMYIHGRIAVNVALTVPSGSGDK